MSCGTSAGPAGDARLTRLLMALKPRSKSPPVDCCAGWVGAAANMVMRVISRTLHRRQHRARRASRRRGGGGGGGGHQPPHVRERGRIDTQPLQRLVALLPLGPRQLLLRAQEPDDEQPKLVERVVPLGAVPDEIQYLVLVLLGDALLELEEVVELPVFDALEQRRRDVHVHVQDRLPLSQLGQQGDGGAEVVRRRRRVVLEVLDRGRPRLPRQLAGVLLVPGELGVDVFGDLGEGHAGVLGPEEVVRRQIVGLARDPPGGVALVHRDLHRDAVQLHVEDVVDQRLVRPRVRQHRDEVDVTVDDDHDRP